MHLRPEICGGFVSTICVTLSVTWSHICLQNCFEIRKVKLRMRAQMPVAMEMQEPLCSPVTE